MNDLRLTAPALAAWITALVCTQIRAVPVVVPVVLALLALLALGALGVAAMGRAAVGRGARLVAVLAVCLAVAAAVAAATAASVPQRTPAVLDEAAASAGLLDVRVEVSGSPVMLDGPSGRMAVDVTIRTAVSRSATAAGLAAPAVLFASARDEAGPGDELRLSARIEPGRDGDRETYVLTDVGGAVAHSSGEPVLDAASGLRAGFVELARTLPGDGAELLPGLAVGDTTLVDDALDDRMTGASLSHLTAVSGANCALVVGAVLGLLALCGASRWVRVGGGLVALAGFVVLVTPEPSVVRAAVMAAIVLVSHGLGRRSLGGPVLFLAVVVCFLIDPWLSREFGFALSVAATAGLLFLSGPLTALMRRAMPSVLAAAVALPLAAQLACQPIIVLLDPGIPIWGIPANMLAAPAAPIVTVLGMLSCLLLPVLPGPAALLGALAWVPAQWIAGVAAAADAAPLARAPGAPGVVGVVVAAVVLLLVAILAGARTTGGRRSIAVVLVVVGACYLAVLGGSRLGELWTRPSDWSVAMCDVGQGDAVLVRSEDQVALIDTGPDPDALESCLSDLGIGRIQLLVLSHFDADHVGGVPAVSGRVDLVLHQPPREPTEQRVVAGLADDGAHTSATSAGTEGGLGSLPWRILWPPADPTPYSGNDGSVVIEFGGAVDGVFLGDLGADSELALLAEGTVGSDYAIVKVAHHGSADQYGPLYERIGARLGLVSCGIDNDYGHPTKTALALLARDGTAVARSDLDGTTLVAIRGASLVTWSSGPPGDEAGRSP